MKHLDLFSGIGGFALAARWMGWQTIGFVEIAPFCQKVLRKHWPGVQIEGDIKQVTADTFRERPDIITGGFPCQPFSVAGKRRGATDDRHLWPEMVRVIKEYKPTWVLGENVAGIIPMELDGVLLDLEVAGYEAWPLVIPACGVDAKHRRARVWIVAHSTGHLRRAQRHERSFASNGAGTDVADAKGSERNWRRDSWSGRNGPTNNGENMADTQMRKGRGLQQPKVQAYTGNGGNRRGEAVRWAVEPNMGRVADGIPRRVDRLRSLGNAIVPQVAYEIFRVML